MGLQLPARRAGLARRMRRMALLALPIVGVLALSGCSEESKRLAMPDPATEEGKSILSLWQGAWIAALLTGVVVWGLIFYAAWRFRRRSEDEIPIQTRYNLPLEIFYTIFPIVMVVVFFSHTVKVQNVVLDDETPENTVYVVGQQWSWTFNYPDAVDGQNVYESGTGNYMPTLVLPVDETTRFELRSPDVIHDFGVPGFLMKMDVMPGQENAFQVTPRTEGTYAGKCYELCGVYHSRMLFNVEVVSREDYDAYLQDLADAGNTSDEPVLGGSYADTQVGAEDTEEGEE
ncbi:MAG: cytochrome c oxidase subunit II [Actinomycetota bacterium]|nr:cytochrome c oxidase subunit II [Actinomycetota bacterium]